MSRIQQGMFYEEIKEEKETLISVALKALYQIREKKKKATLILAEKARLR